MTNDEQRLAWRTYAAAVATVLDYPDDMGHVAAYADALLAEERKRFDTPAQADDATTSDEPRPWVDLSEAEIGQTVVAWDRDLWATRADLVRLTQDRLREKNGGTP
jgi:hypothetical protein